jgi:AraC-like DNA-binding protein
MGALHRLFAENVATPRTVASNLLCRADQIIEAHGLDEVLERFTRLYCPHVLVPSERHLPIAVRHEALQIHSCTLVAVQYSQGVVIQSQSLHDFILMEFALDEPFTVEQGNVRTRVQPGYFYIVDPERPLWQEFGTRFCQLNLRIPVRTFQEFMISERALTHCEPVQFEKSVWPIAALGEFFGLLLESVSRSRSGEYSPQSPRVAAQTEKLLLCLILDSLRSNYTAVLRGGLMPIVPGHLKRAEAWIERHYAHDFTPHDLSRAAGVSLRTLFAAFRTYRGMTPMTYVKGIRLDKARYLLLNPQESQRGVTDIALSCGLSHLSRFARDYRARFGQLPSQTRLAS